MARTNSRESRPIPIGKCVVDFQKKTITPPDGVPRRAVRSLLSLYTIFMHNAEDDGIGARKDRWEVAKTYRFHMDITKGLERHEKKLPVHVEDPMVTEKLLRTVYVQTNRLRRIVGDDVLPQNIVQDHSKSPGGLMRHTAK